MGLAELNLKAFNEELDYDLKRNGYIEEYRKRRLEDFTLMMERVKKAWIKRDILEVMSWLNNQRHMAFVLDNFPLLKECGVYEKALLHSYTSPRVNHVNCQTWVIRFLFELADRERLLQEGDPLPDDGPFTVYRGVAGHGAKRRLRGISWTASLDKAIWFAERFAESSKIEKPMVYQVTIMAEHVYVYSNDRNEQEFLCDISREMKLKKVWGRTWKNGRKRN